MMKIVRISGISLLLLAGQAPAQFDIPPPPGYPGKPRRTSSGQGGVNVTPRDDSGGKTKTTTRIMLSASRLWTSTDGKLLEGRLIAYEEMVIEAPTGTEIPPPAQAPKKPTVIRDGRIRLQLTNRKIVEVPLARLSAVDREFVEQVHKTHHGEAAPS